ncbi:hypothetical protein GLYMA_07G173950v4 [Glycine max]|nr:hypothetical protein GLYMA_07G173950v4 [Glycine max]KAH1087312.1 hypothetical protein GYH30_018729 [Glycine max]
MFVIVYLLLTSLWDCHITFSKCNQPQYRWAMFKLPERKKKIA